MYYLERRVITVLISDCGWNITVLISDCDWILMFLSPSKVQTLGSFAVRLTKSSSSNSLPVGRSSSLSVDIISVQESWCSIRICLEDISGVYGTDWGPGTSDWSTGTCIASTSIADCRIVLMLMVECKTANKIIQVLQVKFRLSKLHLSSATENKQVQLEIEWAVRNQFLPGKWWVAVTRIERNPARPWVCTTEILYVKRWMLGIPLWTEICCTLWKLEIPDHFLGKNEISSWCCTYNVRHC